MTNNSLSYTEEMSSIADNNKRIAKNTLLLYFRMLFSMGVSLYTSRVVLNALGVEDYGIYNVVGGVVAMFSLISASLSSATSRFFTFELGKNNHAELRNLFSTAITIHLVLAVTVMLLAEVLGVWFLNYHLNIPTSRMPAANWVFQCSILSFAVGVLSVPFNASIIAHERMNAFAYIGILDVVLRLCLIICLANFPFFSDKLIVYAIMLSCVSLFMQSIYMSYCRRHFTECRFRMSWNRSLINKMSSFAGWNFIGCSSAVLKDQGVNILLNMFCGPAVNAARGISYSVNAAVGSFVGNFMTALNPQITKSYASGNYQYMESLAQWGSRFSFYILLILALPILFETDFVLKLWLKDYPEHTANFVRLVLVLSMVDSLSNTLITLQLATGKIRNYQLAVGGMLLMNFPVSYIFLKLGYAPEVTMVVAIVLSLACLFLRLTFLRWMVKLSVGGYLIHVLANIVLVSACASILPCAIYAGMDDGLCRFVLLVVTGVLWTSMIVYLVGCSSGEKIFIRQQCVIVWKRFSGR